MATPRTNGATSSNSKDEAVKARLIKYMNTEHAESLSLYLRNYSGLSASAAENPRLVGMSYSSLTIESADGNSHEIAIVPRMESWSDVRPRVVAMDRDARAGLGMPPLESSDDHDSFPSSPASVTVTTYESPRAPLHIFMIGVVIFFYGCYFARRNGHFLVPGGWYWENVMVYFPLGGAKGYAWLQDKLAVPVVLLHGVETLWMVRRLQAYGVGMATGLWWKWIGATFLEGFGAHQRFSAVSRQGGRKEKDAGRRTA
jgi:hypothetical protein